MVNKDLGIVTAYAYAVSKGYTGTEDEFAALMADYADVGERAEAAATAAAASATAASGSASDSAASATAAEGFAGNASTSAGNASQAAQNASQSATAASGSATSAAGSATAAAGSATTAGNKATEAAQSATAAAGSATTAGASATAAQAAQTAAETAQTAAETAQEAAEDAAESVEGKAAQIDQNTADISSVKNALGATLITDTASGAIATFTDGADGVPMESVTVQMEPIQDLHGQDAPYPAGGGKNLLPPGESRLSSGITFTVNSDGTVTASGTASAIAFWGAQFTIPAGTYTHSGCPSGVSGLSCDIRNAIGGTGISGIGAETGGGATFTISEPLTAYYNIRVQSGTALNNVLVKPMICLSTASNPTTFAPYSNICPISGRSEVGVWRGGANLIDDTNWGGYSNEVTLGVGTWYAKCFIVSEASNINTRLQYYNNGTWSSLFESTEFPDSFSVDGDFRFGWTSTNSGIVITVNKPTKFRFDLYGMNATRRLTISSTQLSAYEPYQPIASITVQLGQTVYGGTVDAVSGVMTVDRAMMVLSGSETWSTNTAASGLYYTTLTGIKAPGTILSNAYKQSDAPDASLLVGEMKLVSPNIVNFKTSFATVDAWKAELATNNVQLCYELATPVTVQLTAQQLTSLLGTNNVWSDGGNVSVKYVADTKQYIAKVIAAALA